VNFSAFKITSPNSKGERPEYRHPKRKIDSLGEKGGDFERGCEEKRSLVKGRSKTESVQLKPHKRTSEALRWHIAKM